MLIVHIINLSIYVHYVNNARCVYMQSLRTELGSQFYLLYWLCDFILFYILLVRI